MCPDSPEILALYELLTHLLTYLNLMKYHPECTETHDFQIKTKKKFWGGALHPPHIPSQWGGDC